MVGKVLVHVLIVNTRKWVIRVCPRIRRALIAFFDEIYYSLGLVKMASGWHLETTIFDLLFLESEPVIFHSFVDGTSLQVAFFMVPTHEKSIFFSD